VEPPSAAAAPEATSHPQAHNPQRAAKALLFKLRARQASDPIQPMLREWVSDYWPATIDVDVVREYVGALIPHILELMTAAAAAKVTDTLSITVLQVFDNLTDAGVYFAFIGKSTAAYTVGGVLAFSFACQALLAYGLGQGLGVAALALLGLKPIVDAYNDISNAPRRASQTMNHAL
jgi:hypothetical protein